MPLIPCPDCQTEISDAAPSCIKCGRPLREKPNNFLKSNIKALIMIFVSIAIITSVPFVINYYEDFQDHDREEIEEKDHDREEIEEKDHDREEIEEKDHDREEIEEKSTNKIQNRISAMKQPEPAKTAPEPKAEPAPIIECLPVSSDVIGTINAKKRNRHRLDLSSGWAVAVTTQPNPNYSISYEGFFIAAKYEAPAASRGNFDVFYTDDIYAPQFILNDVSQTAKIAFENWAAGQVIGTFKTNDWAWSKTVANTVGDPPSYEEYYDAIQCAMENNE
jgi:hypothetical protein